MNNTAKLFGLFKFDAFNDAHIKNVKKATFTLNLMLALLFLFLLKELMQMSGQSFSASMYFFIVSLLAIVFMSLVILLVPKFFYDYDLFLYLALSKVNADHLIKEIEKKYFSLKLIAEEDIRRNGYFSAAGYLEIKEKLEEKIKIESRNAKKRLEEEKIKSKYPNLFKD